MKEENTGKQNEAKEIEGTNFVRDILVDILEGFRVWLPMKQRFHFISR